MNDKPASKVPVSIWMAAFSGLAFILIISGYFYQHFNQTEKEREHLLACFKPERLKGINNNNGLTVVGTSLIQYGFPFDDEFEALAKTEGIDIEFIRFTRYGHKSRDYEYLGNTILKARPHWVFLEAELFFMEEYSRRVFYYKWLEHARNNVQFLFKKTLLLIQSVFFRGEVLYSDCSPRVQNDTQLPIDLDQVATIETVINDTFYLQAKPPLFPEYFESFLKQAKADSIKVILLEMNRSKEGNEQLGDAFRSQLSKTLQQAAERYQIPLWQFRSDLPLDYYTDRAHLNRKGRAVFSKWFLSKLAQENRHD